MAQRASSRHFATSPYNTSELCRCAFPLICFLLHNGLWLPASLQSVRKKPVCLNASRFNLPSLQFSRGGGMLSGLSRSSDGCDLTKLMNTHQTRQIPDCLCLDQPSVCIPPGTAHVSRGFSTWTIITTPFWIQVACHGKSLLKAAIFTAPLYSKNIIVLYVF